jgi:cell filamentation protein
MTGRYEGFGPEAEFEPRSRGRVLRNRLGITSMRALERRESEALLATTQQVIDQVTVDQNFTAAAQVLRLMQQLEQGPLRLYTPCRNKSTEQQAAALAIVHAELTLIHPFRDGNGRYARLLAVLMGLQAGLPALDFGGIRGAKKRRYIAAVHTAMDHNYAPMTEIFREVIARTLKSARQDFL